MDPEGGLAVEGQQDSLWPLQQLVKMWSNGARDEEIERVVQMLKDELRRRGHEITCRRTAEA